jgi:hypothetical protein
LLVAAARQFQPHGNHARSAQFLQILTAGGPEGLLAQQVANDGKC